MSAIHLFSQSLWNLFTGSHQQSDLSPVGQAIEEGKYEIALALIKSGASVQIIEKDGSSNLQNAVSSWMDTRRVNIDLIKALLSRADVKTVNYCKGWYNSALNQASYSRNAEAVYLLIASGAVVNNADHNLRTSLMHAVSWYRCSVKPKEIQMLFNRQLDTVRALVLHGAQVNAVDRDGLTSLQIHVKEQVGHRECHTYCHINSNLISFLVEHWADPPEISIYPNKYMQPLPSTLKKIKTAVQEGLVLRSIRTNGIACELGKVFLPLQLAPLVLEYEP